MKFVHTADLHLTAGDEPRARVAFDSFKKVCALAKEKAADLLIIAGDAFHSANDAQNGPLLARFRAEVDALVPTKVLLIPGNHELGGTDRAFRSVSEFGTNCEVYLTAGVLEIGGVSVHAFPFKSGSRTGELFASLPALEKGKPRVAVLHGTAKDRPNLAMYDLEGGEPGGDLLIADADLATAGFRYSALGHIHKPDAWTLSNGGLVAYPGSPWCVNVKEQDERSVRFVEIDAATGAVKSEAILLGTPRAERREFFVIPGGEAETAEQIEAYLMAAPGDVWRVVYARGIADRGVLDAALDAVELRCRNSGALPPEVRRRDRYLEDFAEGQVEGVALRFINRLRERIQAAPEADREVLQRAAVLGWLALRNPRKKPEDELLKTLEEAAQ